MMPNYGNAGHGPRHAPIEAELAAIASEVPDTEWPKTIEIERCPGCKVHLGLKASLITQGQFNLTLTYVGSSGLNWVHFYGKDLCCSTCGEVLGTFDLETP